MAARCRSSVTQSISSNGVTSSSSARTAVMPIPALQQSRGFHQDVVIREEGCLFAKPFDPSRFGLRIIDIVSIEYRIGRTSRQILSFLEGFGQVLVVICTDVLPSRRESSG
jgi:hypothetical protein